MRSQPIHGISNSLTRLPTIEMPAVTVENVLTLPRLPDVNPVGALERPLLAITTAPQGVEGEGFPVRAT